MIEIYYSSSKSGGVTRIDKVRKGSWINVVDPTEDELIELALNHNLELDLMQDALDLYESPRLEIENNQVYVFTRFFFQNDEVINATEPVLIIYHPDFIITLLRKNSPIFSNLTKKESTAITTQRTKLLLQMFIQINGSYHGYMNRVTRYILKVRSELKKTNIKNEALLGLIEIEDDLNEILSALQPYSSVLKNILNGKQIRLFEDDKDLIEDLSLSTNELIDQVKSRLKTLVNIRQAYEALATSDLNRTFKSLTSISIFLMVPTIMAGIYGMNIILPFQNEKNAFWIVAIITFGLTALLLWLFNRKHWL
jgi:magnesium transporter